MFSYVALYTSNKNIVSNYQYDRLFTSLHGCLIQKNGLTSEEKIVVKIDISFS